MPDFCCDISCSTFADKPTRRQSIRGLVANSKFLKFTERLHYICTQELTLTLLNSDSAHCTINVICQKSHLCDFISKFLIIHFAELTSQRVDLPRVG